PASPRRLERRAALRAPPPPPNCRPPPPPPALARKIPHPPPIRCGPPLRSPRSCKSPFRGMPAQHDEWRAVEDSGLAGIFLPMESFAGSEPSWQVSQPRGSVHAANARALPRKTGKNRGKSASHWRGLPRTAREITQGRGHPGVQAQRWVVFPPGRGRLKTVGELGAFRAIPARRGGPTHRRATTAPSDGHRQLSYARRDLSRNRMDPIANGTTA